MITSLSSVVFALPMSKTRSVPLASIVARPRPLWTIVSGPDRMSRSPFAARSSPVLLIVSS